MLPRTLTIASCCFLLLACAEENERRQDPPTSMIDADNAGPDTPAAPGTGEDAAPSEGTPDTSTPLAAVTDLPVATADADCAFVDPIDLCAFAPSIDAFLVADVLSIGPSPHWVSIIDGESRDALDCAPPASRVHPGLEIRVRVRESVGASDLREVSLFVGGEVASQWAPRPVADDDGSIQWVDADRRATEPPLVGQTVGFFIQRLDDQRLWTLVSSMPLGSLSIPDRDEAILVESSSALRECQLRPDLEALALTADELLDSLNACNTLGTNTDMDRFGTRVGAHSTYAGACNARPPENGLTCASDSDCPPGTVCDVLLQCVQPEDATPIP